MLTRGADEAFMLVYQRGHDRYKGDGSVQRQWLLRVAGNSAGPAWDSEGEDGLAFGRSIKSGFSIRIISDPVGGRTIAEVCRS